MGICSNFVFAEPANMKFNMSLVHDHEYFALRGCECKEMTLKEFGEHTSGWKILKYFDETQKGVYKRLLEDIHAQNTEIKEFKIHYWCEDEVMFYLHWDGTAKLRIGEENTCDYFIKKSIFDSIRSSLFGHRNLLITRFEYNNTEKVIQNKMDIIKEISKKDKDEEKVYLYMPEYLRYHTCFKKFVL